MLALVQCKAIVVIDFDDELALMEQTEARWPTEKTVVKV
jgi:hypothetical protein